ncbi:Thioredoxin [[Mycoplasma] cavipharyngis]|uniref:thioredoxin domain-containing protein n=1 Tax=[Mycoplasma] cavipharyngis TaxID=92757 RepID=UPI00370490BE
MKSYITVETAAQFKKLLETEKFLIVDYFATWCPPCKMFSNTLDTVIVNDSLSNSIQIVKVNVDDLTDIASQQGVHTLPTVAFYHQGKEVHRFFGFKPIAAFLEETKHAFGESAIK